MNLTQSGFKQRLIGAVVLIALAILFLPAIFDGQKSQQFDEGFISEPPQTPERAILAKALEQQSKVLMPQNSTESMDKGATSKSVFTNDSVKDTNDKKRLSSLNSSDKEQKSSNYVVQVASFAEHENAVKLVKRLKAQGLKAYIGRENFKRSGRAMIRVLIGPMLYKKRAQRIVEKVEKLVDLKAEVVEFDPLKH